MAELEPNDLWQDRGIIKIADGVNSVDITSDSELKVIDESTQTTTGAQKQSNVRDSEGNELLFGIYKELKKINLHLSLLTDTCINNSEV